MKYHLITYGCQMNTADSEEMAQPLKDRGFLATAELQEADIVMMNTCTVREQAEHRADSNIGRLRVWKAKDPHRILIVAGCAASRWGNSIKQKYPFIDLVSPATQIEQFPEAVAQVLKERWNWAAETTENFGGSEIQRGNVVSGKVVAEDPGHADSNATTLPPYHAVQHFPDHATTPFIFGSQDTAYITIMRGCNYSCSYCIVPQVRGREIYRPMDQILSEIRDKVRQGFKEVMLLGQTVNSYYSREDTLMCDFSDLLRAANAMDGLERIRFMSPHPKHMRDRVIQAMAECSKVCRHIHLPLQSGSTRLLAAMNRLYTRDEYIAITQKLRSALPDLLITTDIIVGYPGESRADFDETLSLLIDIRFDGLFAFKYSPRPGTTSAEQTDNVPDPEKDTRLQEVLALNQAIKAESREVLL